MIFQTNILLNQGATFAKARSYGAKVGLGVNLEQKLEELELLFGGIDVLLLQGVSPGFGGQKMRPVSPERAVRAIRMIKDKDLKVKVAVDGGVKLEYIRSIRFRKIGKYRKYKSILIKFDNFWYR